MKKLNTLFAAMFLGVFLTAHANAQTCPGSPGCLDPTFGPGGTVITRVPYVTQQKLSQTVVQSDGKIVALFAVYDDPAGYRHSIARFQPDGTLDASFGIGGWVNDTWATNGRSNAIAIQIVGGEERFVLAGGTTCGTKICARAERFTNSGSFDTSFGTGGISTVSTGWSADRITVVPSSQKILMSGGSTPIVRLNSNGSPDTSFGSNGISSTNTGIRYNRIILQADGKIMGVGTMTKGSSSYLAVARFNTNGKLDDGGRNDSTPSDSFGTAGKFTTTLSGTGARGNDAVVLETGSIVVAGEVQIGGTWDAAITRITSSGTLDTSFGTGGSTSINDLGGAQDYFQSVVIDTAGRIVASGLGRLAGSTSSDFLIARFTANGAVDTSFGNAGFLYIDIYGLEDTGKSLNTQIDPACSCERLIFAGHAKTSTTVLLNTDGVIKRFSM